MSAALANDTALLPLYRRDGTVIAESLVDAADFEWLTERGPWRLGAGGYAYHFEQNRAVYVHRLLMGLDTDSERAAEVDHINRDKLDNRRANLRIVAPRENRQNMPPRGGASRFRGVSLTKEGNRWKAAVRKNGKLHYLGQYADEIEAAAVVARFMRDNVPLTTLTDSEEILIEYGDILGARRRLIEARDAHPELSHWKLPWQLEALDRHLARLKEIA